MCSRTILSSFLAAVLLSSCAYQGVIVEKRFRPLPFSESLGMDAIYNFRLRDGTGEVHSQMVTPEVYAVYREGESFNDLQPPPVAPEGKDLRGPVLRGEPELQEPPVPYGPEPLRTRKPTDRAYHPVRTTQTHSKEKSPAKVASHKHHGKKAVRTAKSNHHASTKSKVVHHKKKSQTKTAAKHRTHHHSKTVASAD